MNKQIGLAVGFGLSFTAWGAPLDVEVGEQPQTEDGAAPDSAEVDEGQPSSDEEAHGSEEETHKKVQVLLITDFRILNFWLEETHYLGFGPMVAVELEFPGVHYMALEFEVGAVFRRDKYLFGADLTIKFPFDGPGVVDPYVWAGPLFTYELNSLEQGFALGLTAGGGVRLWVGKRVATVVSVGYRVLFSDDDTSHQLPVDIGLVFKLGKHQER